MNQPDVFSSVQFIHIDDERAGQRIDNFLLSYLKGVPKSRIYRIIRKGEIRVNKGRIKPEYKLCGGDTVRIPPIRTSQQKTLPQPGSSLSQLLETAVVFENEDLLVVNKPSGLAVHGGSGISLGVIESFRQIRSDCRFLELVHRLDRETSGCLMIAKKRSSLRHMQQELRAGRVQKKYRALVAGHWPNRRQSVDTPLVKNQLSSGERIVRTATTETAGAKASLTRYRVITRYQDCTYLEAQPVTGRTHQIRVHCQSAGCAIIGDDKYCDSDINKQYRQWGIKRLFLHAHTLQCQLPDQSVMMVEAPVSEDLMQALTCLDP